MFPYTDGGNAWRDIPVIPSFQNIQTISVFRDGAPVELFRQEVPEKKHIRVKLPTVVSSKPVVFDVRYRLSYGVMKWSQNCDGMETDEESNPRRNIWRWRAGSWDQTFDELEVRFVSTDSGARLDVLGERFDVSRDSNQNVSIRAVAGEGDGVEVYVVESGTDRCSDELRCFETKTDPLDVVLWVMAGVMIGVLMFPFICCIVCLLLDLLLGRHNSSNGHGRESHVQHGRRRQGGTFRNGGHSGRGGGGTSVAGSGGGIGGGDGGGDGGGGGVGC